MNKNILRDIFKLKMEILEGIKEHLPPVAKERLDGLQRDFLVTFSEAVNEYLGKKKTDEDCKSIKNVSIE